MMEIVDVNLMFFSGVMFAAILVMSFFMWKWRNTVFVPVDRGVPYWYNPEDDIMYTRPVAVVAACVGDAGELHGSVPMQQTSFATRVEFEEFEETLKDVEVVASSKGKKGVRKR